MNIKLSAYFPNFFEAIIKTVIVLAAILAIASCTLVQKPSSGEVRTARRVINTEDVAAAEGQMNVNSSAERPVVQQERPIRIALLVPLSGSNQKLGEAMLDAAQLAIIDIGKKNLLLVPIDSGKDPGTAVKAVNKAIEQRVDIILGPIFSSSTSAIAPLAKQANLNVISFSNDKSLAGDNVFLLGFMPEEQVRRIVGFASKRNLKKFSGFAPDNEYGKLTMEEFRKSVIAEKGSIAFADFYRSSTEPKIDLSKIAQINAENTQVAFIPEGGSRLADIAGIVSKNTSSKGKIQMIGSGQWDDPSTYAVSDLEGAWFVSTPPKLKADFENHFNQVYHYPSPRIASLAYDGVALVSHLASAPTGASFNANAITNPRGFTGVNGIFRFKPNGISERGLTIMEVHSGVFEEIDPAPDNFINFN